VNLAWS